MSKKTDTGKTILVAEDDEDNRFIMKMLLEMRGYRVVTATNGCEAISCAENERPDLILMDLRMPVQNGLATTRQLRLHPAARLRQLPIIALSAYDPTQHRAVAIAAGCNEYVTKPIDYDQLEKLIATFLLAPNTPAMSESATPVESLSL